MPQISKNNLDRDIVMSEPKTAAEAALLLLRIANELEGEICRALLDGNVDLAQRLALPQARIKKISRFLR